MIWDEVEKNGYRSKSSSSTAAMFNLATNVVSEGAVAKIAENASSSV